VRKVLKKMVKQQMERPPPPKNSYRCFLRRFLGGCVIQEDTLLLLKNATALASGFLVATVLCGILMTSTVPTRKLKKKR
jgi:hypothetical protein